MPKRTQSARADADRSFESLYRGNRDVVYRAALRAVRNVHDAEDVTQAAFVDAYTAVLRGSTPESPRAWLLAIAENVRRRRFRATLARPREVSLDDAADEAAPTVSASELQTVLRGLPRAQLEAFVLREISGLSYEEIATRTGTTVPAVQMALFRARQTLRASLDRPAATRRRALAGLPSWLPSLLARGEAAVPGARGLAAAAGAAAVAVGAVAIETSDADPRRGAPLPRAADASLRAAPVAGAPAPDRVALGASTAAPAPQEPKDLAKPKPKPAPPAAAARPSVGATPPATTAAPAAPPRESAAAPPPRGVVPPVVAEVVPQVAAPPVEAAAPVVEAAAPALEQLLEAAAGAADAAGGSTSPLPLPLPLPLDAPPPVPPPVPPPEPRGESAPALPSPS